MNVKVKHLRQCNGRFYYRIKIPRNLQARLKQKEIQKLLDVDNLNDAAVVCKIITPRLKKLLKQLESSDITREDMLKILDSFFKSIYKDDGALTCFFGLDYANTPLPKLIQQTNTVRGELQACDKKLKSRIMEAGTIIFEKKGNRWEVHIKKR